MINENTLFNHDKIYNKIIIVHLLIIHKQIVIINKLVLYKLSFYFFLKIKSSTSSLIKLFK